MAMDEERLYRANDIYEKLKIPFRYLRKQLTVLTKSGLLISVQGKNGGYRISKKLNEISLYDIVEATGDTHLVDECFFGFENCAFDHKCAMHDKWASVRQSINTVLKNTSLAELKETGPYSFITNNSLILTKND